MKSQLEIFSMTAEAVLQRLATAEQIEHKSGKNLRSVRVTQRGIKSLVDFGAEALEREVDEFLCF